MTQWTTPSGGRQRGLRGLLGAWVGIMTRPRQFFQRSVSPGDQGPALGFVVSVTTIAAAQVVAFDPIELPGGDVATGWMALLMVALLAMLVAPTAVHLVAAVQTVILAVAVPDRAGVSETVQVLAYASAPCVIAGVPVPEVRVIATAYATVLFVLGLATVHDVSVPRAAILGAVPASLAFGLGFRGFTAAATVGSDLIAALDSL